MNSLELTWIGNCDVDRQVCNQESCKVSLLSDGRSGDV